MNLDKVRLGDWDIEVIDQHLVFSFNGEKRMVISKDGNLHIKNDLVYLTNFPKESLDDLENFNKKRQEEWNKINDNWPYPIEFFMNIWQKIVKLFKKKNI